MERLNLDKENVSDIVENYEKLPPAGKKMFFQIFAKDTCNPLLTFGDFILSLRLDYSKCESPIEVMLALALDYILFVNDFDAFFENNVTIKSHGKTYRADFLVSDHLIVECDGHEFHEKTKEQVKRGNRRNYDLQIEGYEVIHFSGNEIYNAPFECAERVVEYLIAKGWENGS